MSVRFSIITVCYNAREVLPAAVASLAAQSHADREWIVVDGGSKDGTQAWVQETSPEKPSAFVSERDKGIYDAMNKGIALARGDVLFFLNADDALHDAGVLGDVAARFEADPGLDMVYGDVVARDHHESVRKRFNFINRSTIRFEDLCHQVIFVRKRVFEQVGGFRLEWPTSADYDWMIRVFNSGSKTLYLQRDMAYFSRGGAHAQNPQALMDERRRLRLQYASPALLGAATVLSRAIHKLSRIFTGLAYGESRVESAQGPG